VELNNDTTWHTNHPYAVILTMAPVDNSYVTYGIKNVVTGVVEGYVSQLAKAIALCDLFAKELKEGYLDDTAQALNLLAALKDLSPTDTGSGGPLN